MSKSIRTDAPTGLSFSIVIALDLPDTMRAARSEVLLSRITPNAG